MKQRLTLCANEAAAEFLHPIVWKMIVNGGWFKVNIDRFRGEYDFLSNFYEVPIQYGGLLFGSNEAAFQAQKCVTEKDKETFCDMRPSQVKAGRQVHLREDWEIEEGNNWYDSFWGVDVNTGEGENHLGKILMKN